MLDAAYREMDYAPRRHVQWVTAAVLRAAADQVVPDEPEPQWWEPVRPRFNRQCIRRRLLTIAAELEGQ